jgi:hypothetical protein
MGGTFRVHGKDNTFILSRVLVTTRRDMDWWIDLFNTLKS